MSALNQSQREELRLAVREQLMAASPAALPADVIARRVRRSQLIDFKFEDRDAEAALTLLVDLDPPQAKTAPHQLGATRHYQAAAAGVLAHERGA